MSRSKSFSPACPLASGRLATFCGGQFHSMASQAFSDLSLRRVLHPADPAAPGYWQETLYRLRRHGDRRHCVAVLHRKKSFDKVTCRAVHRHSRCVHIECLFMRICHPSRYRTERVAACWTAACHALAFAMLAVTRCREATCNATWRHAHVHAHVHEQCSSSLRGLYSCISRKRDIT